MTTEQLNASSGQNDAQISSFEQEEQPEGILFDVTDGLKSKHTQNAYRLAFNHFLKVTAKSDNLRVLLDYKHDVIERLIINHIKYLIDVKNASYWTIQVHCSGILHFFKMNDISLNVDKIKRFLPEDESERYGKDRPYSVQEIERILEKCDVRSRVVILLMESTGMRVGALPGLRIEDIKKIDEFGLYMIWVYNRSKQSRYYTFCTPSCANAIDAYLDYRRSFQEQIKDKSPLIREQFNIDNPFTAQAPRPISMRSMQLMIEEVLRRSGVNQIQVGEKRRRVMKSHGFRKAFIHQTMKAGLTESVWKSLVGHKLPKTNSSYVRLTEEEMLAEYVKAIPLLETDPNQRLKQENQELKSTQAQQIAQQAKELEKLREEFQHYKEELKKQIRIDMEDLDDFEIRNKAKLKKQYGIDFDFEWVTPERARELEQEHEHKTDKAQLEKERRCCGGIVDVEFECD